MFPHSDWNDDPVNVCFNDDWCASALSIGGINWSDTNSNFIGRLDEIKVWNVTKDSSYFETADSQSAPRIDRVEGLIGNNDLTVTFSEGVYANTGMTGSLDEFDFTLTDTNSDNPRTVSGVTHTEGESTATATMSQQLIPADIDTDTLAAVSNSIFDEYNNAAGTDTVTIGLLPVCPTSLVSIPLNETPGSTYVMDTQNMLYGAVNDSVQTLVNNVECDGGVCLSGDTVDNYIDFEYNTTCLQADTAMTLETRIRPTGISTGNDIRRVFARDTGGGNYQVSVWRQTNTTNWPEFATGIPAGVASIALWVKPVDAHSGTAWKPVLTEYDSDGSCTDASDCDRCPIVSDHWYLVKVVWDSNATGHIPGYIYVDDQGTDGLGTGEYWSGYTDCTDADQSLLPANRHFWEGDEISPADGAMTVGANVNNHANNVFNGLIDWITWKDTVD